MAIIYVPGLNYQAGVITSVPDPNDAVTPNKLVPVPLVAAMSVSGTGAPIGGSASAPVFTNPTNGAGAAAGNPTYRVGGAGYTAYATPTDLIGIRGSASKTVVVTSMALRIQAGSAALQTISLIKRSTANTGGTVTNPTGVPVDSLQNAATAVVDMYTALPTSGAAVGTLMIDHVPSNTSANQGGLIQLVIASTGIPQNPFMAGDERRGITLRGAAESIYFNYAGAVLTGGFTALWQFEWYEY